MPAKTRIVDFLGDKTLVLPALLEAAIVGNERAKYVLSLFQMAANFAEHPQEGNVQSYGPIARRVASPFSNSVSGAFHGAEIAGYHQLSPSRPRSASLVI